MKNNRIPGLLIFMIAALCFLAASCASPQPETGETVPVYDSEMEPVHDLNGYEYVMQFRTPAFTQKYGDSAS